MSAARLRIRYYVMVALAGVTATFTALSLVWPDWIERVFHADPDHHDGTAEIVGVAVLTATTLTLGALAWLERHRHPTADRATN